MNRYSNLDILIRSFPGRATVSIADAAQTIGMAHQTARNKLLVGGFPIATYKQGRRRLVRLIDLAVYLDSLGSSAAPDGGMVKLEPQAPVADEAPKRKRGRPTRPEQMARQRSSHQVSA